MHARLRGLLLAPALVACGTLRADICTTVHTRLLEEERTTEGVPRHVSDPQECALHAERLKRLAGDLRAMEIRDKALRRALDRYLVEVEELAEGYTLLSALYQGPDAAVASELLERRKQLGTRLVDDAADVDGARSILRNTCNGY
jgi:hypothetical protein